MAMLGFASVPTLAQTAVWNLPYQRPASYDFSSLYGATLNTYLAAVPNFFASELAKGWTYYKATFIQANGLVNHQRLQNGTTVIGTNEAVSEGQGYGMLLSLINNDQTTFNKIFEAANQNMWDNGHKSYFKWSLPNGSPGAATDADIDIGVALVFADELEKKGFWKPYNGSVKYGVRAMEIIKSIRQNMTASDHLLPGDNWGGDGINNLNPSYFATAWMKVFDLYQKEVVFKPVIDNAYAVLKKVPRYSLGQAPDWCNTSGQQSSQGGGKTYSGMGMLSDGIRTPYRIAMDALWFNDARAIEYCKNTMKTLTEYGNTNGRVLAAQMGHYDNTGKILPETGGSFDNIAQWSCAVLGSRDPSYSTKALSSVVIGLISGNSANFFGDNTLQDDKFYYKQSIAMLGFAAIGGQFPNIFSDEKKDPSTAIRPMRQGLTGHPDLNIQPIFTRGAKSFLSPLQTPNRINAIGQNLPLNP